MRGSGTVGRPTVVFGVATAVLTACSGGSDAPDEGADGTGSTAPSASTAAPITATTSPPEPREPPATKPIATTPPTLPGPPTDPTLGAAIPELSAYRTSPPAPNTVVWQQFDLPDDRRTFVTDGSTPHQGELFHHGSVAGDPAAPYPGDAAVDADASKQCDDGFAPFVGIDFESSRFGYLYFYPSAETWADGDRGVECVLYGGDGEELLHGSMAGTAQ